MYYNEVADQLQELAAIFRDNSEKWFPDLHDGHVNLDQFYLIGLAGEAGEALEFAKKSIRGGEDVVKLRNTKGEGVAFELADVFIYLLLACDQLGIDLIEVAMTKVRMNEARWGKV